MSGPWKLHVREDDWPGFEVAVVHEDYKHGFESYGWHGAKKIIVASSGTPCSNFLPRSLFLELVRVGQEYADELNAGKAEEEA